ncbi:MAG: hypothetical protein IPG07_03405 [Crocinitomicaceae bacterium]|nr:hypothetical protein [Crocinitomicaceae bacterium]
MKKLVLFIAIILAFSTAGLSQRYNLGFGWRGGVTNYLGDIGGGDLSATLSITWN